MAKKKKKIRLNIKVAIAGLLLLGVIGAGTFYLWYKSGRDPQKFIVEAQTALENKQYKQAEELYGKAYHFSEGLDKVDILFKLAEIAMIEDPGDPAAGIEPKEPKWRKALGIFDKIAATDPKNIEARLKMLDFSYELADMGRANSWNEVKEISDELLLLYDEKNMEPDPFVVLARGRASLEIAKSGSATDTQKEVDDAKKFMNMLLKLEPNNFDAFWHLAHAELLQGEIEDNAGIIGAREDSVKRAEAIIQESIDKNPEMAEPYVNMLKLKILESRSGKTSADVKATIEEQYQKVKEKFPDNAEIDYVMAGFYYKNPLDIDKAVKLINDAVEKEPEDYDYVFRASMINYMKYCLSGEKVKWVDEAIRLAKSALELPEAQHTTGPKEARNNNNILVLNNLLANYYSEKARHTEGEKRENLLASLEEATKNIKEIVMVEENPILIKWRGMLEYLSGEQEKGLRKLVKAQDKFDAQNSPDAQLCYFISRILKSESVIGARQKYLGKAIENNIVFEGRPEAVLDYSEILLKLRSPDNAISLVQRYEQVMGENERSNELLIEAYIQANLFDKAEKQIEAYGPESLKALNYKLEIAGQRASQLLQLRARQQLYNEPNAQNKISRLSEDIREIRLKRLKLLRQIFNKYPESLKDYSGISEILVDVLQEGYKPKAIEFNQDFLAKYPDNPTARLMKKRLSKPDPLVVDKEELREFQAEILSDTDMPELEKQLSIGRVFLKGQDYENAYGYYEKALELDPDNEAAVSSLFDMAIAEEDYERAKGYMETAVEMDIDGCGGQFFAGRLALKKENYEKALDCFNECIEIKPIFPSAYLNLSIIYNEMNKMDQAVENARKAAEFSPKDSNISLNYAMVLYKRNERLGSDVTDQQKKQAQDAILRAIRVNPSNIELQSVYAEYIADTKPGSALAMRQTIFKSNPTKKNALLLARMALKNADDAFNSPKKEAMYRIAEDAYNNALSISPGDPEVLDAYADFYRISGQEDKISQLLGDRKEVLWKSYYRRSQFDKAKETLLELREKDPDNKDYVLGLLGVSIKLFDKENVEKYSKELLQLEDTLANRILRVKSFVEIGAVEDVENDLQKLIENNPDNSELRLLSATVALRKGEFDRAEEIAGKILDKNSKNATAWRIKGKANYLSADYQKALDDFKECKSIKDDSLIRIDIARAYDRLGRYEPAISELNSAVEDESTPLVALRLLEEIYWRAKKFAPLRDYYNLMIKRFPEKSYWQRRLGDMETKLENYRSAEDAYKAAWDKALNSGEDDPASILGYANTLLEQGKNSQVLSMLSKYVDSPYKVAVFTLMGQTRHSMGNEENAMEDFHVAMKSAGIDLQKIKFVIQRMVDSYDKQSAYEIVTSYAEKGEKTVNKYLCLFQVNFEFANYNKAISYVDDAISQISKENILHRQFNILKANTLLYAYKKIPDRDYTERAAQIYEELLKQTPGDTNVLNNLAYLLAESDYDLERAEQVAAKAYQNSPDNGLVLDTYGYTLIKNRKYEKAESLLSRAIQKMELSSTSAPSEVYEHYGLALERLNKPEEAKAAYERALKTDENLPKETQDKLKEKISRLSKRIF
ncbi:tetratricopeptide repeat protein [Sedimentisphaera salicampi]|uniref:tetratricopeptide repeat protein n=1 Tax=Sedimentisphaera salicampi TaxID=1941349 RepID=UPI000B9AD054|nr:tetratricopeptide repeat protein [Sedimentisphaera salicampi]OXU14111.1 tetratricopeptide repeat protein [Sedimentisphaera salicampi]